MRFGKLLCIMLAASACARSESAPAGGVAGPAGAPTLVAHIGEFERRLPLTGEIDAVAALELKVPRVPNGKVMVQYLAPEGGEVKAGDVVVELDATSFTQVLKDRTLQLSQAEIDLERQISANGVLEADKALDVERKRAIVQRAEVDADVPAGILPKRDYLEKQMTLRRARVDLEKAQDALLAQQKTAETDIRVKRIAVEKLRRAVQAAEESISTLSLKATQPGTVIIGDHWEGRKFQEGDDVFMGMTVARVTASNARRVRAALVDVDDGKIAPGMPARVTLDAYPDRSFAGTVRDISPVARAPAEQRAQRRMFTVTIDLAEAEVALLRPGLSARVEVITDRKPGVLLVPRAALDVTGAQPRVYLAGGDIVPVTLGGCSSEACIVSRGLNAGTRLRRATP